MAESFVFYKSFAKATKRMTAEQKAELLDALIAKGIDEEEIDPDDIQDDAVAMAMELIIPQLEANAKRRENGQQGGAMGGRPKKPSGLSDENPVGFEEETHRVIDEKPSGLSVENPNVKEKEKVNDNDKEKENVKGVVGGKRFAPPTLSEVTDYCNQRANGIDPQGFIDYYEQSGWKLSNGQKMVDWKAAVRNWESRRKQERRQATPPKNSFTDYTHQTTYDWDAIEAFETANPVLKNYAGS